jgi:hypothetical protein
VGPDDEVADELEANVAEALRRGAVMSAIAALQRSAQLTRSSARRGHRLLTAAEHAFGPGRVDLVDELVKAASRTELTELDWHGRSGSARSSATAYPATPPGSSSCARSRARRCAPETATSRLTCCLARRCGAGGRTPARRPGPG